MGVMQSRMFSIGSGSKLVRWLIAYQAVQATKVAIIASGDFQP
jgi:hypothetical protein